MRSRTAKRPGPLLHQQRLHRAREQRRVAAMYRESINVLASRQEALAALHAATQEAGHA
jgi:hypothetical protein